MKKRLVGILAVLMASGAGAAAQQNTSAPAREAAIAYWTSSYAGAELAGTGCVAPQLRANPDNSWFERETAKAVRNWRACHRRLMGSLSPEAADKVIPAEVLAAMTPAERDAATRHVAAVHAKFADAAQAYAAKVMADQQAWREQIARRRDDRESRYEHGRDRRDENQNRDAIRQNEVARRP